MKAAAIIFHKNIDSYPSYWIERCFATIRNQDYKDFDVFEIDYGGTGKQKYEGSIFYDLPMPTHTHAHNFLLDEVFSAGYDCAFNVNIDDWYALNRFSKMIPYVGSYDVISSDFYRTDANGVVTRAMCFYNLDPEKEARKGHNIIAHPVVCYSRNFWLNCSKLNPDEIPVDDFMLWKRSFGRFKFLILPDYLLYQRIHANNISRR